MSLHPVAANLLKEAAKSGRPNSHLLPIEEARSNFEATFAALPVEDVAATEDLVVPGTRHEIPVRVYRPDVARAITPLVVYLHGGGWQMGSLDSHDGICRAIANRTGFVILSVEYRRPPEHPFPAAPDDCYAAFVWAVENAEQLGIDPARVALAGDSAGGNLAAAVALRARDQDGPALAGQMLFYPATTFDLELGFDLEFEGLMLFRDEVQWHKDAYFTSPDDALSPQASPLGADLAGLPPTLVITAEYDPIRPQGELFAGRLAEAGVPVQHRRYPGMVHGFAQFPTLFDDANEAVDQAAEFLRERLADG
ncbi:alpha/beta hydrolase [Streptosporangium sp. NPDC001681]|uniref:alpha/beta hydrolase n=1 Tax=Streptosporangium sp. NPDC001681 TaxID=3154395 RepID=UPI003327C5C6